MGIDPAYGSSAFGIVVTEWADGIVQIMHAEEYHRPDYNEMLSVVYGLMTKYSVDKVYIDSANPSFIKSLKLQIGEEPDYDKVIARYRSEGLGDSWSKDMKIVPVNFNKEHKAMLGHCKVIQECDGWTNLITQSCYPLWLLKWILSWERSNTASLFQWLD